MKLITTNITYAVSTDNYCSPNGKELCRFAAKSTRGVYRCCLWNMPLMYNGKDVMKCDQCNRRMLGFKEEIPPC